MKKLTLMAAIGFAAIAVTASAAGSTVLVTSADVTTQPENTAPTNNWVAYVRNGGTSYFQSGPATPPLGVGSLTLNTPTGADKITVFNYDHAGTPLSAIDGLSYSTYRTTSVNPAQVASINLEVDINGAAPGGFTTLVFEPIYNTGQGVLVSGVWQNWDAYNGGQGIWWSSNPIPSAPNRDTFVTWNTIVAANPQAVILGGFGVNQGSGNPALISSVDALSISASGSAVTYNFDPALSPSSKDACKGNGWKTFNAPAFKNQGDCVSYVATGGKH